MIVDFQGTIHPTHWTAKYTTSLVANGVKENSMKLYCQTNLEYWKDGQGPRGKDWNATDTLYQY